MTPVVYIFVLDDDKDTLDLIKEDFGKAGITNYRVFTNATDFLAAFNDNVYLAILDHYPGGKQTGFDLLEAIEVYNKKRSTVAKCKVIIMSGTDDMRVPVHYMNTGKAKYYIIKDNDGSWHYELVHYTKIAIEEVRDDICFEQRQLEREMIRQSLVNGIMKEPCPKD